MSAKNLILYYSYTGNTAKMAKKLAEKRGGDLFEVRDVKRPSKLAAFTAGGLRALLGKPWPIEPVPLDLAGYAQITIMSPIWAGRPTPAINSLFALLPPGKKVEVVMVSGSGKCACMEQIEALLEAKSCTLTNFRSVRGSLAKQLTMDN